MTALILLIVLGLVLTWASRRAAHAARRRDARIADLERHLRAVLDGTRDAVLVHADDGGVIAAGAAAAALLDVPVEQVLGVPVAELPVAWVTDDGSRVDPATVFARDVHVGPASRPPTVVGAVPATGAPVRWVQVSTEAVSTPDGRRELVTSFSDQTGPREIRAALARSEKQFQAAMENAPIGMALLDPRWRLEQVNAALAQLLGTTPEALRGRDLSALSHPEDRATERSAVHRLLSGEAQRFSTEKRYLRTDGQTVWAVLDVVLVRTEHGAPETFVAQVRDVTEARLQAEMLAHRAMHDPLTGLANRAHMHEVLTRALDHPDASGRVALLLVDLDEFKQINDRFGHPTGDEVLVHVGGVLRAATAGRGTVARLGGDEFVVVVEDPDAARVAFEIAGSIHTALRNPIRTQRRRLPVGASVGVAVADAGLTAGGAPAVLAAADTALYRAKAAGKHRTEVWEPSMGSSAGTRHGAAAELQAAIDAGQLLLHYQPTVDLSTGDVVGHEALVRWQHPERGLLLPGAFLATVDETGLGAALGATVIRQAVQYLARTADLGRWVSVNVSARHLGDGEFVRMVVEEVRAHGIAQGRLVVELVESELGEPGSRTRHDIDELRAAGVPVLLDDFGTGAAPLAYLRDLPVDGVKLDMSYAAGIPDDPAATRVILGLGAMAQHMDMVTIAAGIETAAQAQLLQRSGWRYGQGWFFGAGQSEPVQQLTHLPATDEPGPDAGPQDPGQAGRPAVDPPAATVAGPSGPSPRPAGPSGPSPRPAGPSGPSPRPAGPPAASTPPAVVPGRGGPVTGTSDAVPQQRAPAGMRIPVLEPLDG
ncbi:putative bifunctional diguanylate cyclase/phosphodiesterase [Cellulomonas carbonis]|uniref:putative bifunctional diguanylate cyclase/phosphodiesterase n=1 Tax=Cellulomonas carbonis TaxID=1386092 RepID=UPI001E3AAAEA|nr:EAL domain-containing protein [Cellulomonas carbonis]